jgi:hypothetical protein
VSCKPVSDVVIREMNLCFVRLNKCVHGENYQKNYFSLSVEDLKCVRKFKQNSCLEIPVRFTLVFSVSSQQMILRFYKVILFSSDTEIYAVFFNLLTQEKITVEQYLIQLRKQLETY